MLRRNSGPISGYRRIALCENVVGIWRNPDEINDRPVRTADGQNSAYRHHIMKGVSETERPSLFRLALGRFFHLIDAFFNFLNRRMQFFQNLMLFPREFFDAPGLLVQLFQHRVLSLRNAIHPPETNSPADQIEQADQI